MQPLPSATLQPQPITAALSCRWIAFVDASPKTIETYTRSIRQFFRYLSQNAITHPTRADVLAYRDGLRAQHKPATVQGYLAAVKLFFKWTAQEGLYPDIADHIKGAKLDTGYKKDYLTTAQVGALLGSVSHETPRGLRDYAILLLMVTSGLRTIEVARASLGDMRTVADFTALFIQGKGQEERAAYVKLAAPVEVAIRAYLRTRSPETGEAPLFASAANRNRGGRMTTRSISRVVKDALLAAGLTSDRLSAHSLRHTTATLNLLHGGTVEETRQLLRHANINTTLHYSHALERAQNNSEERISRAILAT